MQVKTIEKIFLVVTMENSEMRSRGIMNTWLSSAPHLSVRLILPLPSPLWSSLTEFSCLMFGYQDCRIFGFRTPGA